MITLSEQLNRLEQGDFIVLGKSPNKKVRFIKYLSHGENKAILGSERVGSSCVVSSKFPGIIGVIKGKKVEK